MNVQFEKLKLFFDRIKTIGFWQRIFGWRQVRNLRDDAYLEFKDLTNSLEKIAQEVEEAQRLLGLSKNDNEHFKAKNVKLEASLESMQEKVNLLLNDIAQLKKENTIYKQTETDRQVKYKEDVAALNKFGEGMQKDWQEKQESLQRAKIERLTSMKETWSKHEEKVKRTIKMICDKHTIEYVNKVPFKGSPDNTIKLCDEFIIFDAKSPSSDDLTNFPLYLKAQTESVKKYIKEENVRKDIFLVIPSNTVEVVEQFSYNMADYHVYVVTLDVLEPLMLSLKKIEDYEFVNQLSPEERETICRIIGKFTYMTKRRIQIDHYLSKESLGMLTQTEAKLPNEILEKVIEFEKAEKLNPPQDKRSKQILTKELTADNEKIQKEAGAQDIPFSSRVQKDLIGQDE